MVICPVDRELETSFKFSLQASRNVDLNFPAARLTGAQRML